MAKTLEAQKQLIKGIESPYVFMNTEGRHILQDKLREHWPRVMQKSGHEVPADVRDASHVCVLGFGCKGNS